MIKVEIDVSNLQRRLMRLGREFNPVGLLMAIGLRQLKWINDNFKSEGKLAGGWHPLSPNTVAARRKGSSRILQDTGRLRQSFTSKLEGSSSVWVGTNVEYAGVHEHGGKSWYDIRPVRRKALAFMTVDGMAFAKFVRHPPMPRRRMLPTEAEARRLAVGLIDAKIRSLD